MDVDIHELKFLFETCSILIKAQENEALFNDVTKKICIFFGALSISLWRINFHKEIGPKRIAIFQKENYLCEQLPTMDFNIASLVIRENKALINQTASELYPVNKENSTLTISAFPLYIQGELIGVLNCWRDKENPDGKRMDCVIPRLLNELAHALNNAMEYTDIRRKRLDKELEIARKIQTNLNPQSFPELQGLSISARNLTAYEVGGDYVDVFMTRGNNVGLAIGDVMGKGIPAALWMTIVRSTVRMAAKYDSPPHVVLGDVNETLYHDLSNQGMFITLIYAWYNPSNKSLLLSNAGHLNPILFRSSTGEHMCLKANGTFIGCMSKYNYRCCGIRLQPGDIIFLYTDGLTETINPHNHQDAVNTVVDIIRKNSFYKATEILDKLYLYLGQCMSYGVQQDDISCLLLKVETE